MHSNSREQEKQCVIADTNASRCNADGIDHDDREETKALVSCTVINMFQGMKVTATFLALICEGILIQSGMRNMRRNLSNSLPHFDLAYPKHPESSELELSSTSTPVLD